MKTISTFVFAHTQEIILQYKSIQKFHNLPNLKYVLVGKNSFDAIENMDDVIVCQKYVNNIEDYKQFTAYTGWYVLWKNNLVETEYVNLFEYDINALDKIEEVLKSIRKSDFDFIGYLPMEIKEDCYMGDRRWVDDLIKSIHKNYDVDMDAFFADYNTKTPDGIWSSTSNCTFSKEAFDKYMTWFEPIFEDLKTFEFGGHTHERSLSFYYLLKDLKVLIKPNCITHLQINSHNTSPLGGSRHDELFHKLL